MGFKFYCLVMVVCGLMNSAMWIYASARPGVMRDEVPNAERWRKAIPTLIMPAMLFLCLIVDRAHIVWVIAPAALSVFVLRRIVAPRFSTSKPVDSAA